ncbi:hypothetical protein Tco_0251593 [Tanacetum coccineum]
MSMTIQSSVKDKILATQSETSKYEYEIRYHPCKENVAIEALRRKERVKPKRVRAMAMTIQYGVRGLILAAQSEAFKQENGMMRTVVMDEAHASSSCGTFCAGADKTILYTVETLSTDQVSSFSSYTRRFQDVKLAKIYIDEIIEKELELGDDQLRLTDGERMSQTLEDIMRACVIDFGGSYQLSIRCAPFEALYGRKCRSPVLWTEIGKSSLIGPEFLTSFLDDGRGSGSWMFLFVWSGYAAMRTLLWAGKVVSGKLRESSFQNIRPLRFLRSGSHANVGCKKSGQSSKYGSNLVFTGRQVKTELKLEEKFQEICEKVATVVKEREYVVEEIERLSGNHVSKETARLLRHGQKYDLDKMTRLQIMVNESHLGVREKHTFVSKMNLGTLGYVALANLFWYISLDRSMDSKKYLEGQSMQRPPLFESDSFIYWKNRFETYVKSKDLDLCHAITNGDFQPIVQNSKTKLDEVIPFDKQIDDLKKRLAKNNEAKMVIYNALPRKEYERIFMCNTAKENWKTLLITHQDESIDIAFARFKTIITSLKALDEGYSRNNYVRKFLRALHPKWRAKVTTIEESKVLTSLSLDELIGNLKVYEMIIKKDSEIVKEKVERKSLDLKAKKESSNEECSTFESEDEEYAMANDKKTFQRSHADKNIKSDRKCFRCSDPKHLIGECPKPSKGKNQRAFVGGSWSDSDEEDDEKVKNKMCLVAQASSEICLGVDLEPDKWIKDSGCSKHMTGNRKLFSSYKAYNGGNVIFW